MATTRGMAMMCMARITTTASERVVGQPWCCPHLPHPAQECASEGSSQLLRTRGDTRSLVVHPDSIPGFHFVSCKLK